MYTQKFENNLFQLEVKTENGESLFDVETVAKSLGITQMKNGKEFVRWERINEYLKKYSPQVGKGDFISEPMVYKLAFKANNPLAEKFQDWLAIEVLPAIRQYGSYQAPADPREQLRLMYQFNEQTASRVDDVEKTVADLQENQPLPAGDYNAIASRINKRVYEIANAYSINTRDRKTIGLLFKDINGGVKRITGTNARTQLRARHYDLVMEFINAWEPSSATKFELKQTRIDV